MGKLLFFYLLGSVTSTLWCYNILNSFSNQGLNALSAIFTIVSLAFWTVEIASNWEK